MDTAGKIQPRAISSNKYLLGPTYQSQVSPVSLQRLYQAKSDSNIINLFESKNDRKSIRHYPRSSIIEYKPETTKFGALEIGKKTMSANIHDRGILLVQTGNLVENVKL